MSGDSEAPPTYYFNGILFNPAFYTSASSDYITATTGKKLFLSYPIAQGSETFPSNITLLSTLTDTSGSKGLSGQVLSSTVSGTQWIYSGSSGYIAYNLSSLPFTLPTTSYSNLYILFTGTVGSGGIMTIPITGFTAGTLINIKNASSGTVNISTTSMLFTTSTTSTTIFAIFPNDSLSIYFNGSYWIQTAISNKVANLTVSSVLTVGSFGVDTLIEATSHNSSSEINLFSTTTLGDMFLGKILPAPYTVRIANTTTGPAGASVHCSNIGFDDNKINNATAPTTGLIKLGNAQTTGPLYLGCGSTTAARTTGPIFIGSDSTASGGINIGTGTDLTVPTVNTVNIGKSGSTTNINGTTIIAVANSTDYSSTSASTNMEFGKSSTTGAIYIGHNQTGAALNIGCGTGAIRSTNADINIGTNGSASSIGNVNIGYAGSSSIAPPTSVQLNGLVKLTGSLVTGVPSGTTGILAGRRGYDSGGATTINANLINATYLYIISSGTTITVTLPSTATDYQIISIRSITNVTHTITAGGVTNIFPIGVVNAITYTLPVYGAVKYMFITNTWYQII